MLYEFTITPDVFQHAVTSGHDETAMALLTVLRGLTENGIFRNLRTTKDGTLLNAVTEALSEAGSSGYSADIKALLTQLHRYNRVVIQQAVNNNNVPDIGERWLRIAETSNQNHPFAGIGTSPASQTACGFPEPPVFTVDRRIHDKQCVWGQRPRTRRFHRTASGFKELLAPSLRFAGRVDLIDPHFAPNETRWHHIIDLCVSEISSGLGADIERVIAIHVKDTSYDAVQRERLASDWRNLLQTYLRPEFKNERSYLEFEVYLWAENVLSAKPDRFHSRHVLSDICGIGIEYGLDVDDRGPSTGEAYLLDAENSEIIRNRYDQKTSPFTLTKHFTIPFKGVRRW